MMNGYSVTEAASVLGVPTERVWELLARGVLAGAPEGETGMRVFLQPRSAPAPVTAVPEEDATASRANGPDREMSPFRELLTEFRNLTERYGQALLALGESRGEVASLRSRVDLLEARIDLRLPMGPPAMQWPTQAVPVPEPSMAGLHAEVAVEPEAEEEHRRKRRRGRRATESFAEALARAEDPSPADLPEAGARADADAEDVDRSLPRDALPAEPVLVADEAVDLEPTVDGIVDAEPESSGGVASFADEEPQAVSFEEPEAVDFEAQPEAVGLEPSPSTETESVSAGLLDEGWDEGWDDAVAEAVENEESTPPFDSVSSPETELPSELEAELPSEPEPSGWTSAGPAGLDDPEPAGADTAWRQEPEEALLEVESIDVEALPNTTEPEPVPEAELTTGEPEPAVASDVAAPDEPAAEKAPEATDFDPDRYTSVIEQPDWFEAEVDDEAPRAAARDDTVPEIAEAAPEPELASVEEEAASEPAADAWPETDDPFSTPDEPTASSNAPAGSGADEMEVAGGGQAVSVAPDTALEEADDDPEAGLPGSHELDEALEAFGELGTRPRMTSESDREWPPADSSSLTPPSAERLNEFVARARQQTYGPAIPGSPATRAYRRLRRIFPT